MISDCSNQIKNVTGKIVNQSDLHPDNTVTWTVLLDEPLTERRTSKCNFIFYGSPVYSKKDVLNHRVSMDLKLTSSGYWLYTGNMKLLSDENEDSGISMLIPNLHDVKPAKLILDKIYQLCGKDKCALIKYVLMHNDPPYEIIKQIPVNGKSYDFYTIWFNIRKKCNFDLPTWFRFQFPEIDDSSLYVSNNGWLYRDAKKDYYKKEHTKIMNALSEMNRSLSGEIFDKISYLYNKIERKPYEMLVEDLHIPIHVADCIIMNNLRVNRTSIERFGYLLKHAFKQLMQDKHGLYLNCVNNPANVLDYHLMDYLFCLFDELETFYQMRNQSYGHMVYNQLLEDYVPICYDSVRQYSCFSNFNEWFDYFGFIKKRSVLLDKADLLVDTEFGEYHLYDKFVYKDLMFLVNLFLKKRMELSDSGWKVKARSRFKKPLEYKAFSKMSDKKGQLIKPTDGQKRGLDLIKKSNFCFILGGPGTGKTSLLKEICRYWAYNVEDSDIILMAPTGVAAQNLKTNLGNNDPLLAKYGNRAVTICYWLKRNSNVSSGYTFDWDNGQDVKLTEKTLIVVDEISMVTVRTIVEFFEQIGPLEDGPTVVFMGDNNQLPPIGDDPYLNEICRYIETGDGNWIPNVVLDENKRQENSGILLDWVKSMPFYHEQCQKKLNTLPEKDGLSISNDIVSFFLDSYSDCNIAYDANGNIGFTGKEIQLYESLYTKGEERDKEILTFIYQYIDCICGNLDVVDGLKKLMILLPFSSSKHVGVACVNKLNEKIKAYIKMKLKPKYQNINYVLKKDLSINRSEYYDAINLPESDYPDNVKFRIGDRVLNTVNLPKQKLYRLSKNVPGFEVSKSTGVYNGDLGFIERYYPSLNPESEPEWMVSFDDGRYAIFTNTELIDYFEYGYALTVHKAQGCEAEHVLFVLPYHMSQDKRKFLKFNLLFTACTRAKKSLTIVYNKSNWTSAFIEKYEPVRMELCEKLQKGVH